MQFGIREICDVVFKAKSAGYLNPAKKKYKYVAGQPVLFIDSAKTSTMEGAATTVYAQGGRGNTRLLAWEGEKTLTFTVEDALLSEMGFAILSGAGLLKGNESRTSYVHQTSRAEWDTDGKIDLSSILGNDKIDDKSPIFVMTMTHGSFDEMLDELEVTADGKGLQLKTGATREKPSVQTAVFVDYYVERQIGVTELVIDMENFAGYYYVEASTLFKRQSDGKDLPAELIFPNVKIQSNFTFSMASTGDPSTFTFTMDAMPGYTRFDRDRKVLCAMQIIDEEAAIADTLDTDSATLEAEEETLYPTDAKCVNVQLYTTDGNYLINTIAVKQEATVTLPTLADSNTSTFTGWSATIDGTDPVDQDYTVSTSDVKLYAIFTAKA